MPNIYLRLNTGYHYFQDETLLVELRDPGISSTVLDATNLNANIFNALNRGVLVQIDEATYYSGQATPPPPATNINPTQLITIREYLNPIPANADFFFYYEGKWYKSLYIDMMSQLLNKVRLAFRVGTAIAPFPAAGDPGFTHPQLVGKLIETLFVTHNGVEIYHKSFYDEAEQVMYTHWDLDNETGYFTLSTGFLDKDIVAISQI